MDDVEYFLSENPVDERAATALRTATPEAQQHVLEGGSLQGAGNPSSALIGRLRQASRGPAGATRLPPPAVKFEAPRPQHRQAPAPGQLDQFIDENQLDDSAAAALLGERPEVQFAVMARGPLTDAKNPSSAVMGRIRDAKAQRPAFGAGGVAVLGGGFGQGFAAYAPAPGKHYGSGMGAGAFQAMTPVWMQPAPAPAGVPRAFAARHASGRVSEQELQDFIAHNGLDEAAERCLRSETPEVQAEVLTRGPLTDCNNPSSALMGRLRDARQGSAGPTQPFYAPVQRLPWQPAAPLGRGAARGGPAAVLAAFIADNGLDESAARVLQTETPEVQAAVLERGPLTDCTNPSSAVMGRIRDARRSATGGAPAAGGFAVGYGPVGGFPGRGGPAGGFAGGYGPAGGGEADVEQFIEENGLDDMAARVLRSESAEVQMAVIARGSLADCTNPSSALMGRLRDARPGSGQSRAAPY